MGVIWRRYSPRDPKRVEPSNTAPSLLANAELCQEVPSLFDDGIQIVKGLSLQVRAAQVLLSPQGAFFAHFPWAFEVCYYPMMDPDRTTEQA